MKDLLGKSVEDLKTKNSHSEATIQQLQLEKEKAQEISVHVEQLKQQLSSAQEENVTLSQTLTEAQEASKKLAGEVRKNCINTTNKSYNTICGCYCRNNDNNSIIIIK